MASGFEDDYVVITNEDISAVLHPPYLDDISSAVDGIADVLWPVNQKIHDNPELGYEEVIAHATLTSYMKDQLGWKVTPSAYGIPTAWVALYDSGKAGPTVSFNVEMGKDLVLLTRVLRPCCLTGLGAGRIILS